MLEKCAVHNKAPSQQPTYLQKSNVRNVLNYPWKQDKFVWSGANNRIWFYSS